jgi:hypothetical protein
MTHLRTVMTEELVRRNYSESTRECYIRTIKEFALHFDCSPDKLGLEHIRIFQAHLLSDRKLSPNTVNQRLAALRFFFVKTLHRPWNTAETPYPKRVIRLPKVLSPGEVGLLIDSAIIPFHAFVHDLYRNHWVVHCKRPFGGPEQVLKYLGRYTHRVAISNHRLVSFENGEVTFTWRDRAHGNVQKEMKLPAEEFLRRFLLHLLPKGFVRIRNFGFLASRRRSRLLPLCFQCLGSNPDVPETQPAETTGLWKCPKCGGPMIVVLRVHAPKWQPSPPPASLAWGNEFLN